LQSGFADKLFALQNSTFNAERVSTA